MAIRTFLVVGVLLASFLVISGLAVAAPPSATPPETLAKGGQLYDNWWKTAGVDAPTGDQPLWATQATNARKGLDTWRCKECHGWDYKGKDGAYGSGSHKTGFVGVVDASKNKTVEQIAAVLKGSSNPNHNFAPALNDASINALAAFIKEGVVEDLTQYVDYATKKPKEANIPRGKEMYGDKCAACHGADGKTLNFGSEAAPEWVGTIAVDNPQEFMHKATFGQPATGMPAGVQLGWSAGDSVDVLAHAQTLPAKAEAATPVTAPAPASATAPETLAKGGQLYDNWWKTAGVDAPTGDQPLWATQTTNTRKGLDTWRCKECHGWDYKGKDGAYGSGSHKTGFVGVVDASKNKTVEQIAAALKGAGNPNHNFAPALNDASINALAAFIKEGVVEDLTQYVDYATKKPKEANIPRGKEMYGDKCAACHGADGKTLNFGSKEAPEWVGTIAVDNPQEFMHKATFGQPATGMPAGVQLGWSAGDSVDVLAHAQTLPAKAEAATPASAAAAPKVQAAAPTPTVLPKSGEPAVPVTLAVVGLVLLGFVWIARKLYRDKLRAPLR